MGIISSTRPVPEDYAPAIVGDILARQQRGEAPQYLTYDGFPLYADDPLHESHMLLDAHFRAAGHGYEGYTSPATATEGGRAILATPKARWAAHLRAALERMLFRWTHCVRERKSLGSMRMWSDDNDDDPCAGLLQLVPALLRGDPPLTEDELAAFVDARKEPRRAGGGVKEAFKIDDVIRAAESLLQRVGMTPTVKRMLYALRDETKSNWHTREDRARLHHLDDLLGETPPERKQILDTGEPWAEAVLKALADADTKAKLEPLLQHCASSESSKPSGKWLKEAKRRIDACGAAEFSRCGAEWLTLAAQPRTKRLREEQVLIPWKAEYDIYSEKNENLLKGLAWSCAAAADSKLVAPLGALAEWCYKKVPNVGPRSPKVGNGCLIALIALPGQEPRAELSRLKAKVKQPTARKMIEKAIGASAEAAGMTPDDLEELAVGKYGLTEVGRGERKMGDYTVETRIDGTTKVEQTFTDAKGKSRTSVPADLKSTHADDVKAVQQAAKDVAKMLPALRDRLERMPMNRRELPMSAWRERYLDHPVVGTMARRLIWEFVVDPKQTLAAAWLSGKLVDASDKTLDKLDEEKTIVRLWHPVHATPDQVLAWRTFLSRHEITQPFKQAHREVYLLTDAERTTETYSNRFAAHILRQHQFAALCTQRGWKYKLVGSWDSGGGDDVMPTIELPRWNLRAQYWIPASEIGDGGRGSGVSQYICTDQVCFIATGAMRPMRLADVPPLAFSEVMRDIDLFVGVASAGNDPNWVAAGEPVGDYWHQYSFGELSTSADIRRQILEQLVPKLKIADRCEIKGRYLVVRGSLRTYKIHVGSTNILMEPNDQYLCIVPGSHSPDPVARKDLFLPFEGDQMLSIILSKAFLLAADAKITDPTITRQIRGS